MLKGEGDGFRPDRLGWGMLVFGPLVDCWGSVRLLLTQTLLHDHDKPRYPRFSFYYWQTQFLLVFLPAAMPMFLYWPLNLGGIWLWFGHQVVVCAYALSWSCTPVLWP